MKTLHEKIGISLRHVFLEFQPKMTRVFLFKESSYFKMFFILNCCCIKILESYTNPNFIYIIFILLKLE